MSVITDAMTVTELSRLTNKSRPTVYKWVTLYDDGKISELPKPVAELFGLIEKHESRSNIYNFCETVFFDTSGEDELREIIELIRNNKEKLDLQKIKNFITEELNQ